jgi:hypothetical protein
MRHSYREHYLKIHRRWLILTRTLQYYREAFDYLEALWEKYDKAPSGSRRSIRLKIEKYEEHFNILESSIFIRGKRWGFCPATKKQILPDEIPGDDIPKDDDVEILPSGQDAKKIVAQANAAIQTDGPSSTSPPLINSLENEERGPGNVENGSGEVESTSVDETASEITLQQQDEFIAVPARGWQRREELRRERQERTRQMRDIEQRLGEAGRTVGGQRVGAQ